MAQKIFALNPGSTSTKVALYSEAEQIAAATIRHPMKELDIFERVAEQKELRKQHVLAFLRSQMTSLSDLTAIVARGGLVRPIPGGTYTVNEKMLTDLKQEKYGSHASNLGAWLAYELAAPLGIPAYIVDPVVTDELAEVARFSGLSGIDRRSVSHALNQKAVARKVLQDREADYEKKQLIVAHLGGGISIAAHKKGRMVDVINGLDGEGPFTPERTGALPLIPFTEKIIQEQLSLDQVRKLVAGWGGLASYLGETDLRVLEERIRQGDKKVQAVVDAMCYQIAKGIGEMAIPLEGKVDLVLLTGGMSYSAYVTQKITKAVSWLAAVEVFPGEYEMMALYQGAKRVLEGVEPAKTY